MKYEDWIKHQQASEAAAWARFVAALPHPPGSDMFEEFIAINEPTSLDTIQLPIKIANNPPINRR